MTIFKPSKILLYRKIKENPNYLFGNLLDAGCGGVNRYCGLFPGVKNVTTLDINKKNHPDIVASVEDIPVQDNFYDSIICTQVIGDIADPCKVIKEFSRILKIGGAILLSESFMNEMHNEPLDYWRFTKYGMRYLFESNGFEIVKIEQIGGFFAVVAQNKIRYFIDRLDLYNSKKLRFFLRPILNIYGKFMLFLDNLDKSEANNKYAIGWLVIARKTRK